MPDASPAPSISITITPPRPLTLTLSPPVAPALAMVVGLPGPPGPPGSPGSSSGAATGYNHTQPTPSTVWTIPHNLGYQPDVTTFDTGGVVVEGTVINMSTDVVVVTFDTAIAGSARCV